MTKDLTIGMIADGHAYSLKDRMADLLDEALIIKRVADDLERDGLPETARVARNKVAALIEEHDQIKSQLEGL